MISKLLILKNKTWELSTNTTKGIEILRSKGNCGDNKITYFRQVLFLNIGSQIVYALNTPYILSNKQDVENERLITKWEIQWLSSLIAWINQNQQHPSIKLTLKKRTARSASLRSQVYSINPICIAAKFCKPSDKRKLNNLLRNAANWEPLARPAPKPNTGSPSPPTHINCIFIQIEPTCRDKTPLKQITSHSTDKSKEKSTLTPRNKIYKQTDHFASLKTENKKLYNCSNKAVVPEIDDPITMLLAYDKR